MKMLVLLVALLLLVETPIGVLASSSSYPEEIDENRNLRGSGNKRKVLVKFKSNEGKNRAKNKASKVKYESRRFNIVAIDIDEADMADLENDPDIELVDVDQEVFAIPPVIDDDVTAQNNKKKSGKEYSKDEDSNKHRQLDQQVPWGIKAIQADQLNPGPYARHIKICVVDTGYDINHEDLPGHDTVGGNDSQEIEEDGDLNGHKWDFDGHGHGTHCAGTIAALGFNDNGVIGVIKTAKPSGITLHIGKGLDDSGSGTISSILEAVDECMDAFADIISMSLVGSFSNTLQFVLNQAYENGTLLVAAAGNDGDDSFAYPASYGSVMSVGAVKDSSDEIPYYTAATFSQHNSLVEVAAPGVDINSTLPGNKYEAWDGTSMATPHVAGAAALIWSYDSTCTAQQIRRILLASTKDLGSPGCDEYFGHGMVQVKDAIDMLLDGGCSVADDLPVLDANGMNNNETRCSSISYRYEDRCKNGGTENMTLELLTDNFPQETSWVVVDSDNIQAGSGDDYSGRPNTLVIETVTLCKGKSYDFSILDEWRDGICCGYGDGSYTVKCGDKVVKESNGTFEAFENTPFDVPDDTFETPRVPVARPRSCNDALFEFTSCVLDNFEDCGTDCFPWPPGRDNDPKKSCSDVSEWYTYNIGCCAGEGNAEVCKYEFESFNECKDCNPDTTSAGGTSTPLPTTAPMVHLPTSQVPSTPLPTTQAPSTSRPRTQAPSTSLPTTQSPSTTLPTQSPSTSLPSTKAPWTSFPTTQAPSSSLPTSTQGPLTPFPTTQAPSTALPTTPAPTTHAPSTPLPTTLAPSASVSTTEVPTTFFPVTWSPSSPSPTTTAPSVTATTQAPSTALPTTRAPSTSLPTTKAPSTPLPTTKAPSFTSFPTTLAPSTSLPTTEAPSTQLPATGSPLSTPPTTTAPSVTATTQAPSTALPTTRAPSTSLPTTQAPSTPLPTTRAPSLMSLPTTLAPSTSLPTTGAPTTQLPVTRPPSTPLALTQSPATLYMPEAPLVPLPTTQAPTTSLRTTQAPSTHLPTTQAQNTLFPTTNPPSTPLPTTMAPSTPMPATHAPSTALPTTRAPFTPLPTTQAPSSPLPTTQAPSTPFPTTQAPSTSSASPTFARPTARRPTRVPPTEPSNSVQTTATPPVDVSSTTASSLTTTTTTTQAGETTIDPTTTTTTTTTPPAPGPSLDQPSPAFGVNNLVLVDAALNEDIPGAFDCVPTACLDLAQQYNIRADTFGDVGSVRLTLRGAMHKNQLENVSPFALWGDIDGNYFGKTLQQGDYTVSAQAFGEAGGRGEASEPFELSFSAYPGGGTPLDSTVDPSTNASTTPISMTTTSPTPNSTEIATTVTPETSTVQPLTTTSTTTTASSSTSTSTSSLTQQPFESTVGPTTTDSMMVTSTTPRPPESSTTEDPTTTTSTTSTTTTTTTTSLVPAPAFGVSNLVLVDAESNSDVPGGGAFDCVPNAWCLDDHLSERFNIRAETFGDVGSVRLQMTGAMSRNQLENVPPFALWGDVNGNYFGQEFRQGHYTVTAQAFSESAGRGEASEPFELSFSTFPNDATPPAPIGVAAPTTMPSASVPTTTQSQVDVYINAGGRRNYVDPNGNIWLASVGNNDESFSSNGLWYATSSSIANTNMPILYQSEHYKHDLAYAIPLLNGYYNVSLHFAEIFFDVEGRRIFHVAMQEEVVLEDYDIYRKAGGAKNRAVVVTIPRVQVLFGMLKIDFIKVIDNPKVSAIHIVSSTSQE